MTVMSAFSSARALFVCSRPRRRIFFANLRLAIYIHSILGVLGPPGTWRRLDRFFSAPRSAPADRPTPAENRWKTPAVNEPD
jgi:hypothetical protein